MPWFLHHLRIVEMFGVAQQGKQSSMQQQQPECRPRKGKTKRGGEFALNRNTTPVKLAQKNDEGKTDKNQDNVRGRLKNLSRTLIRSRGLGQKVFRKRRP